jgi:hypothetical protein
MVGAVIDNQVFVKLVFDKSNQGQKIYAHSW